MRLANVIERQMLSIYGCFISILKVNFSLKGYFEFYQVSFSNTVSFEITKFSFERRLRKFYGMKEWRLGQIGQEQGRVGQDRIGQDQGRIGQDRIVQDRIGQDRIGQDRTGQEQGRLGIKYQKSTPRPILEVNFCKNAGSKTPQMNFEISVFGKSAFFRSYFTLES